MKIIGTSSRDCYIVEASETELMNIAGFDYSSEKGAPTLAPGLTVKVHGLWKANTESRQRKKNISKLANQLREQANALDAINAALAEPVIEVKVA